MTDTTDTVQDSGPAGASGNITNPAVAQLFMLAGNARVTLVSKRTGTRFTYKIRQPEAKPGGDTRRPPHFVSLLTGPDNGADFQYLGCIFPGNVFRQTAKSRISGQAPSVRAFEWAWGVITAAARTPGGTLPESLEVWHEGRCGRCGRALTDPESIASGLGPVCAGR